MKKLPIYLLTISYFIMISLVMAYGAEKSTKSRLLGLEREIRHLENLGGKHIKPKEITTGNIDADDLTVENITSEDITADDVTGDSFSFTSAQTRYYVINPGDLVPYVDGSDYIIDTRQAYSGSSTVNVTFSGGIRLPHGAIITSVTCYWYRDDAAAVGEFDIYRAELGCATQLNVATANSNSSTSPYYHSVTDSTINGATVDNTAYSYQAWVACDPNNADTDVIFKGAVITYTITVP